MRSAKLIYTAREIKMNNKNQNQQNNKNQQNNQSQNKNQQNNQNQNKNN